MKRLFWILSLFISFFASAQVPQGIHTWYNYDYLRVLKYAGVPQDTFAIPTALKPYAWLAVKQDTLLFIWAPTLNKWKLASGSGASPTLWGDIGGSYLNQTDLVTALNGKQNTLPSGTASEMWLANGTKAGISATVLAITDPKYALLIHNHDPNQINGLTSYVRGLFSATGNATYNSTTGVFNITGGTGSFSFASPMVNDGAGNITIPNIDASLVGTGTFTASRIADFNSVARGLFSVSPGFVYNSSTGLFGLKGITSMGAANQLLISDGTNFGWVTRNWHTWDTLLNYGYHAVWPVYYKHGGVLADSINVAYSGRGSPGVITSDQFRKLVDSLPVVSWQNSIDITGGIGQLKGDSASFTGPKVYGSLGDDDRNFYDAAVLKARNLKDWDGIRWNIDSAAFVNTPIAKLDTTSIHDWSLPRWDSVNKTFLTFRPTRNNASTLSMVVFDSTNGKWYYQNISGGGAAPVVFVTVADLRSMQSPSTAVRYYTMDAGKEGFWQYDAADNTSADNTGTILVNSIAPGNGTKRFKRIFYGSLITTWFDVKGDNTLISQTALNNLYNASKTSHVPVLHTNGTYLYPDNFTYDFGFNDCIIYGENRDKTIITTKNGTTSFKIVERVDLTKPKTQPDGYYRVDVISPNFNDPSWSAIATAKRNDYVKILSGVPSIVPPINFSDIKTAGYVTELDCTMADPGVDGLYEIGTIDAAPLGGAYSHSALVFLTDIYAGSIGYTIGVKNITVTKGKNWATNQSVVFTSSDKIMAGTVNSYDAVTGAMAVNITTQVNGVNGASYSNWALNGADATASTIQYKTSTSPTYNVSIVVTGGRNWLVGQAVQLVNGGIRYMAGTVQSYNSSTKVLTVTITIVRGGVNLTNYTGWIVNLGLPVVQGTVLKRTAGIWTRYNPALGFKFSGNARFENLQFNDVLWWLFTPDNKNGPYDQDYFVVNNCIIKHVPRICALDRQSESATTVPWDASAKVGFWRGQDHHAFDGSSMNYKRTQITNNEMTYVGTGFWEFPTTRELVISGNYMHDCYTITEPFIYLPMSSSTVTDTDNDESYYNLSRIWITDNTIENVRRYSPISEPAFHIFRFNGNAIVRNNRLIRCNGTHFYIGGCNNLIEGNLIEPFSQDYPTYKGNQDWGPATIFHIKSGQPINKYPIVIINNQIVKSGNYNPIDIKQTNVPLIISGNTLMSFGYSENVVTPYKWKIAACRAASTANVNIASPANGGTSFIVDGVTPIVGERILLRNQTTPSQNGPYTYNGLNVAMTRTTDADASAEFFNNVALGIDEGALNGGLKFYLSTADPITLGTTSLTFTQTDVNLDLDRKLMYHIVNQNTDSTGLSMASFKNLAGAGNFDSAITYNDYVYWDVLQTKWLTYHNDERAEPIIYKTYADPVTHPIKFEHNTAYGFNFIDITDGFIEDFTASDNRIYIERSMINTTNNAGLYVNNLYLENNRIWKGPGTQVVFNNNINNIYGIGNWLYYTPFQQPTILFNNTCRWVNGQTIPWDKYLPALVHDSITRNPGSSARYSLFFQSTNNGSLWVKGGIYDDRLAGFSPLGFKYISKIYLDNIDLKVNSYNNISSVPQNNATSFYISDAQTIAEFGMNDLRIEYQNKSNRNFIGSDVSGVNITKLFVSNIQSVGSFPATKMLYNGPSFSVGTLQVGRNEDRIDGSLDAKITNPIVYPQIQQAQVTGLATAFAGKADIGSSFTTGRVPFASNTTSLIDDAGLVWDNTNKRLKVNGSAGTETFNVEGNIKLTAGGLVKGSGGTSSQLTLSEGAGSVLGYSSNNLSVGGTSISAILSGTTRMGVDGTSAWLAYTGGVKGIELINSNGTVKINSLKTGVTAPTPTGTQKMVITDQNGQLSYLDIPAGGSGGSVTSFTFTDGNGFTGTVTNSTTTPTLSLALQNAAADGVIKGQATFNANDFNAALGVITLDYTNAQKATSTLNGILTSTDWNTFNGKANASHTHAGTDIISGIIAAARLGTGTANNTSVLYGDNVWRVPALGEVNTASNKTATVNTSITAGLFSNKSGVDLQFKPLSAPASGGVTITGLTNEVELKDNMWNFKQAFTATTADNALIDAVTVTLPSDCAGRIILNADAMTPAGASRGWTLTVYFHKNGGVLTIDNTVSNNSTSNISGSGVGVANVSNNLVVQVGGVTATTIWWNVGTEVIYTIPHS